MEKLKLIVSGIMDKKKTTAALVGVASLVGVGIYNQETVIPVAEQVVEQVQELAGGGISSANQELFTKAKGRFTVVDGVMRLKMDSAQEAKDLMVAIKEERQRTGMILPECKGKPMVLCTIEALENLQNN